MMTLFFLVPFFVLDLYFGYIEKLPPSCSVDKKLLGFLDLNLWFSVISML